MLNMKKQKNITFAISAVKPASIVLFILVSSLLFIIAGCQTKSAAETEKEFTIIALPDTQYYSAKYPHIFYQQTAWVRDNSKKLNCKFVIHEGDIVDVASDRSMWQVADKAMTVLDDNVPYCFAVGNKDLPSDNFNKYFPVSRCENKPWYGGHFGKTNDNSYQFFKAAGMDFMIICLCYDPNEAVLEWANKIVDEHPGHRVIVATHSYLVVNMFTSQGVKIWSSFVKKHKNIFLVLCGHILVGRRTDTGDNGNTVYSLLADYQKLDNGGNGWLRIIKFIPAKNTIEVRTYSPMKGRFFSAGDDKYSTESMNKFDLRYDMSPSK
jgi:hypothetical protein